MKQSTTRPCAVEECGRAVGPHGGHGWCPKHYKRWKATGDPTATKFVARGASMEQRLHFYLDTSDADACWEWQGFRDSDGYGRVSTAERVPAVASRVAYETWVGVIPSGLVICHTCDNPPCCNPRHLFAGTAKDNTHDMLAKQRGSHGERHHWQRISDNNVHLIRYLSDQGIKQRVIARMIGCSQAQVSNIVRQAQRKHDTNWTPLAETLAWVAKNAHTNRAA